MKKYWLALLLTLILTLLCMGAAQAESLSQTMNNGYTVTVSDADCGDGHPTELIQFDLISLNANGANEVYAHMYIGYLCVMTLSNGMTLTTTRANSGSVTLTNNNPCDEAFFASITRTWYNESDYLTITITGPRGSHRFGEWQIDAENDGHYRDCLNDNCYKRETGDHEPGAAATCTTPQTCTSCPYVFQDALGHTPERKPLAPRRKPASVAPKSWPLLLATPP